MATTNMIPYIEALANQVQQRMNLYRDPDRPAGDYSDIAGIANTMDAKYGPNWVNTLKSEIPLQDFYSTLKGSGFNEEQWMRNLPGGWWESGYRPGMDLPQFNQSQMEDVIEFATPPATIAAFALGGNALFGPGGAFTGSAATGADALLAGGGEVGSGYAASAPGWAGGGLGTAAAGAAGTAAGTAGTASTLAQAIKEYGPVIGPLLASGMGAYAANKQSESYEALARELMGYGAPSRGRYEASFTPGFSMVNDPGYKDALDQTTKAFLHKASVTGNPVDSPNAWMQTLKDVNSSFAYPALQEYRRLNAGTGGLAALTGAAPNASSAAIGAERGIYDALGAGAADIFNPPKTLEQVLKGLKVSV